MNRLEQLRDVGGVDVSDTVRVNAGRDEAQTPTITVTMTLSVDDAAKLAWESDFTYGEVTALFEAIDLARTWIDFQAGVA